MANTLTRCPRELAWDRTTPPPGGGPSRKAPAQEGSRAGSNRPAGRTVVRLRGGERGRDGSGEAPGEAGNNFLLQEKCE